MKPNTLLAITALLTVVGCSQPPVATKTDPSKVKTTEDNVADRMIRRSQAKIEKDPNSATAYSDLGMAFAQKGRETGVLSWYDHAKSSLEKAVKMSPNDPAAMRNLAYVSTIFHSFKPAVKYAESAIKLNPRDSLAYGVLTDSYLELGQYEKAVEVAQKMVDLKPDLGSYSRAAKLKWIYGDVKGAILTMDKALNCGAPYAENTAWCAVMLGDMYFKTGALPVAERQYLDAMNRLPDYRHACAGMSRVRFAQSKFQEAAQWMQKACVGTPPLTYVAELGEIYEKMGEPELAKKQYEKVLETSKEFWSHGIEGDELAVSAFLLDHTGDKARALDMVEKEVKEHTSVEAYSTLAWAYYKNNRPKDAARAIDMAMKTGIQDSLVWYRASLIANANGETKRARQLAIKCESLNPHFSMVYNTKELFASR